MSDKPSIQIDSDWKRQAQEEKRQLAEQEAKAREEREAKAAAAVASSAPASTGGRTRELPPPSFATLVQQSMTQALFYLGELAEEGQQPVFSLDMARHYIDTLDILSDKTKGNLTPDEQTLLDQTLYDLRGRFVGIARQMIQ